MTTIDPRSSPLPACKPSGWKWLKALPKHWEARKLKHCLGVNESTLPETTDPDLEFRYIEIGAVNSGDLVEPPAIIRFSAAPSRARRIVKGGDTIVSTVRTYLKAVWYAEDPGDNLICSTGFAVLTPKQGTVPKFASYVAQSAPFTDQVTAESVGIAYPAIGEKKLGDLQIGLPPPEEQTAIVRYLDEADQQIQAYISAKKKLIALLAEQRQAVIHQAVTQGLDPNVKLKPSGVEWLGDMPEHWDDNNLSFLSKRVQNGTTPPTDQQRYYENGTIPWYGPSSWTIQDEAAWPIRKLNVDAFNEGKARLIQKHALLVVVIGATAGRMALLPKDGSTNQQITAFEIDNSKAFPQFLLHQMRQAQHWLRATASTATIPIISSNSISKLPAKIPPLSEQSKILEHIQKETRSIDAATELSHRQITIMEEYHTRLIADVVTGKLDVRKATEELPQIEQAEISD